MSDYSYKGAWLLQNGLLWVAIFAGIVIAITVGRAFGKWVHVKSDGTKTTTDDTLIGSILGLMALVMAFTFSGANTRLDQREHLVMAETFAIQNAYQSIRHMDAQAQASLRPLFAKVAKQRIVLYDNPTGFDSIEQRRIAISVTMRQIEDVVYDNVVKLPASEKVLASRYLLTVAAMIQAFEAQVEAVRIHPPRIIWFSLLLLILIGSFLAGYKMGISQRREGLLAVLFAALIACAIHLTLSMEFPMFFGKGHLQSNLVQAVRLQGLISADNAVGNVAPAR